MAVGGDKFSENQQHPSPVANLSPVPGDGLTVVNMDTSSDPTLSQKKLPDKDRKERASRELRGSSVASLASSGHNMSTTSLRGDRDDNADRKTAPPRPGSSTRIPMNTLFILAG
jgi:hypothetical protein